ncbi:type IV secretion system protein [Rhizobium mongolense]|uniref:type IV secretion system protein n=1 Tax=Rhizobium mongolense TaxID=57676 RepID=UPI003557050F
MDPVSYAVNFYGDALRYFDKINVKSLEAAWGLFAENRNLVTAILALFLILYFLWGALGLSSVSLQDMAVTGFKVALAYAFVTSWAMFYDQIGQLVLESPKDLGSAISSAMGGGSAGQDIAQQVASMARKVYNFTMELFKSYEGGMLPNIVGTAIVFIVLVFGLLPMLLILTGVTLYAKMITAIMLAMGPIAILAYFFGITRFIFEAWVKGIAYGMFMLLFTYIMAGLSFGFLIGMMDTITGEMATKENALAIVVGMVLYLLLISYFVFQVPEFARAFAYNAQLSVGPSDGGVTGPYQALKGNLASRNNRAAQGAAVALGMLAGPKGAAAAAALAGRGGAAGAGALGRMLTARRRNGN